MTMELEVNMTKKVRKPLTRINFTLANIEPMTENQEKVFASGKNLLLHGAAGTGKTFLSLFTAFNDVTQGRQDQVVIVRSVVPTREVGFLKGSMEDKVSVYETAYHQICAELFNRGDAYSNLKDKRLVEFTTTSHMRAITIKNSVIVVDECQNMTFHELDSIITRVGPNCRVIFSGDLIQSDLVTNPHDVSGLRDFAKVLKNMDSFDFVEFGLDDIVRSDLVKEYLITKYNTL